MLMTLLFAFIGFSLRGATWMPVINTDLVNIKVAGVPLSVEVADEPQEHKRGLVGREALHKNRGMFFVFQRSAKWRVTTRGMVFSIDIFWISETGRVVDMQKYAAPSNGERIFSPRVPAKYILETNADFAEIYGIKVGDYVTDL